MYTDTTIISLIMVFAIQHSQNKDNVVNAVETE